MIFYLFIAVILILLLLAWLSCGPKCPQCGTHRTITFDHNPNRSICECGCEFDTLSGRIIHANGNDPSTPL